jgi:isopenicillin N synthase-like dioxygenase
MTTSNHTMPSTPFRYQDIPCTTASLPWADLITIDLSLFSTPSGKTTLAASLKHAISTVGFFYVINFGLSESEVDTQFSIAHDLFSLPDSAKQPFRVDPTRQGFFGWKPRGSRKQQFGLRDSLELYDDPKWNSTNTAERFLRPSVLEERQAECEKFQRHMHFHVLRPLLILSAIIMELEDEEELWKMHNWEAPSQCHLRYMLYHPRTPSELQTMKENNVEHNVYGHTDFGTFTLLQRQPVAGLQVKLKTEGEGKDGEWKWVKPLRGSITVNVADTLSFLTGGYLESSIHRVVLPPEDQMGVPRYGVIYFAGPDDDTRLKPVDSPLLRRLKKEKSKVAEVVGKREERALPPGDVTAGEWVRVRFGSIGKNYENNRDNEVKVRSVEVKSWA